VRINLQKTRELNEREGERERINRGRRLRAISVKASMPFREGFLEMYKDPGGEANGGEV